MTARGRYNNKPVTRKYTFYFTGTNPYGYPHDTDKMPVCDGSRIEAVHNNQTGEWIKPIVNPELDRELWVKLKKATWRISRSKQYREVLPFGGRAVRLSEGIEDSKFEPFEKLGISREEIYLCATATRFFDLDWDIIPAWVLAWKKLNRPSFPEIYIWHLEADAGTRES